MRQASEFEAILPKRSKQNEVDLRFLDGYTYYSSKSGPKTLKELKDVSESD